jgi:hypothetical protein
MRELALEQAAGSLGDEAYLARLKVLRQQRDAVLERMAAGLSGERALEWLRALGESLQVPDASKEKADVMHALYERIMVAGPEIVGVRLTAAAYAHGLALALPQKVDMARPTGFNRADARNIRIPMEERLSGESPKAPDSEADESVPLYRGIATYAIPIEGRDEWVAAAGLGA